jgi:uncharacterized protein YjbI with pentapeptide repeats
MSRDLSTKPEEPLGKIGADDALEDPSPAGPIGAERDDSKDIRDALIDAANVNFGFWLTYLLLLFYILLAAGGVTHVDLFLENPVRLPILGVDLPTKSFFILGPLIFLVLHAFVLLHFVLLSTKIEAFNKCVASHLSEENRQITARLQLPNNIFVQFLAGPRFIRTGAVGVLLKAIAWITFVVGPMVLFIFLHLQFLPYHDQFAAWWIRAMLVCDTLLLLLLWPAVLRSKLHEDLGLFASMRAERKGFCITAFLGAVAVFAVTAIATFPGEWLDRALQIEPFIGLKNVLVSGRVDYTDRRLKSIWSNVLVLPDLNFVQIAKFDTKAKLDMVDVTVSLRGRNLDGAVLIGSKLAKADFRAASLRGAKLDGADLKQANFECVSGGVDEILKNNPPVCTILDAASLDNVDLRGARLRSVSLVGAKLTRAQLDGTNLSYAKMKGSDLTGASLRGATLVYTDLRAANLLKSDLRGSDLHNTDLKESLLSKVDLQAAVLNHAALDGAYVSHAFVWRTELSDLHVTLPPVIDNLEFGPEYDDDSNTVEEWTHAKYQEVLEKFDETLALNTSPRPETRMRMVRLDPDHIPADITGPDSEKVEADLWNSLFGQSSAKTPDIDVAIKARYSFLCYSEEGTEAALSVLRNRVISASGFRMQGIAEGQYRLSLGKFILHSCAEKLDAKSLLKLQDVIGVLEHSANSP